MIKNYFRILKKPHAYLQTILKTPVKFQKDRTETVGGVKGTKYLLKTRNHAPRPTRHAPRKTKNSVPPLFFEKAGDNKRCLLQKKRQSSSNLWNNILGYTDLSVRNHHSDCSELNLQVLWQFLTSCITRVLYNENNLLKNSRQI